jgi:Gnt-I system low-affinity gluconate transporter
VAIASGASVFSHVNDSGFWLVSQYLKLNERQTYRSWTMLTTVLGLTGLAVVLLLSLLAG